MDAKHEAATRRMHWEYKFVRLSLGKFGWVNMDTSPIAKPGSFFAKLEAKLESAATKLDKALDEAPALPLVDDKYNSVEEAFAALGADGWELVQVIQIMAGLNVVSVFKRPT